jgi:hypothetical protein
MIDNANLLQVDATVIVALDFMAQMKLRFAFDSVLA